MSKIYPTVHESAFVAEGAMLIGDVVIEKGASIWFNAVLRGDRERITIQENANVQDNCVIHCSIGYPTVIGKNVTLGHCALVHGAIVKDNALIGMNAVVLNGAIIGEGSVVAAGAVVREGMIVPPKSLVAGVPAKIIKEGDDKIADIAKTNGEVYQSIRDTHIEGRFGLYQKE